MVGHMCMNKLAKVSSHLRCQCHVLMLAQCHTRRLVPEAAAIRRRRQPLSFKPQSAVKLVASRLSRR